MSDRFLVYQGNIKNFGAPTPTGVIVVDSHTGVNYLYVYSDWGVAITPLLDTTGKPIITK